jgi:LacI family repressor for deo operon, udp, cdd, tsx, nupC, and nupG
MTVSLKDVAEEAGVSVCTVSRVINNTYRHRVSDATRERVLSVIEKLNYEPNVSARALARKQTFLIGLLVSKLAASFMAEIVQGIQDEADKSDYSLLFYSTGDDVAKEKACFEALRRKRADGIIYMAGASSFCGSHEGTKYLNELTGRGIKMVQLCSNHPQLSSPYVLVDNEAGGYMATKHLLDLGHTRIAHFHEHTTREGQERYHGYKLALDVAGVPCVPELVERCSFDWRSGYGAMERLLNGANPPTAVFACDDMSAWGATQAAIDRGVRVPEDVAIVGYDDLAIAEFMPTGLTTIHQPKGDLGAAAVKLLLKQIDGQQSSNIVLQPELVVRQSCGAYSGPRFSALA